MTQLESLALDAKPGCCMACDDPLPEPVPGKPGPKRKLCGKEDCWKLYQCLWARDARAAAGKAA